MFTWQDFARNSKRFLLSAACLSVACLSVTGCSTNPATGNYQFASLMSPDQENKVGKEEHQKIIKQYGLYEDEALQAYVSGIGARVTQQTERPDVTYKFYIIDSPIVNAFALPGGDVYVSRGLLALANSEAELAGVLSHEVGHITARHSAERYSHSVVTSMGATVLSTVIGNSAASQAIGLGSNLYLSGYSRSQETEADTLGLRYMAQGGYDPRALSDFLRSLNEDKVLASGGKKSDPAESYFSTHPPTPKRVNKTLADAANYQLSQPVEGRDTYLRQIDGLVYGDSAKQGFVKKGVFYHPEIGFAFDVPDDFSLVNQPSQVALKAKKNDAVVIFDFARAKEEASAEDALAFLRYEWMKEAALENAERLTVNGMKAATATFSGKVNNVAADIRLVAISWGKGQYARFQVSLPKGLSKAEVDTLKSLTYSLRRMGDQERETIAPVHLRIVTAKAGDRLHNFVKQQAFTEKTEEKFRLLNALSPDDQLIPGRAYKLVVN